MSERNTQLLIEDIKDAAQKILAYTQGMDYNAFTSDDKTIDAVVRNFEVIGEAAKRVSIEYKTQNANIPWAHMVGFRNRIIHEYFGIDYEIVWQIIQNNIPALIQQLNRF